jgi:hypothetical protein
MSTISTEFIKWPKKFTGYEHKMFVGGMNLETQFNDNIENVLIIPGPYSERAAFSVQDVGMNAIMMNESFYYPDTLENVKPEDYNLDIFHHIIPPKGFNKTIFITIKLL